LDPQLLSWMHRIIGQKTVSPLRVYLMCCITLTFLSKFSSIFNAAPQVWSLDSTVCFAALGIADY
jgi:hypothetical protein